jgi:hypothetical protein
MVINDWSVLEDESPGAGVNESQKPHFSQKREKWGTLWFAIEKQATRHFRPLTAVDARSPSPSTLKGRLY